MGFKDRAHVFAMFETGTFGDVDLRQVRPAEQLTSPFEAETDDGLMNRFVKDLAKAPLNDRSRQASEGGHLINANFSTSVIPDIEQGLA